MPVVYPLLLQLPSRAVYGYEDSVATFTPFSKLKADSMLPPPQPRFALEQSTSCCSERDTRLLDAISQEPSMPPAVLKAQQDPHCPWFLTGVTAPLVTQLTVDATASPSCSPRYARPLVSILT